MNIYKGGFIHIGVEETNGDGMLWASDKYAKYECLQPHPFTDYQQVIEGKDYELRYQYLHMEKEWKDCGEAMFNSLDRNKRIVALPLTDGGGQGEKINLGGYTRELPRNSGDSPYDKFLPHKEQTAIQKAGDELVDRLKRIINGYGEHMGTIAPIRCAIICCQSHIDEWNDYRGMQNQELFNSMVTYWQQLKDYLQTKL